MVVPQSGASSLPRCFRYDRFQTPEPRCNAAMEPADPMQSIEAASPRPRMRVRRVASVSLGPPTDQFLASVAVADMPIPSIEEPEPIDEDDVAHHAQHAYPVSHSIGDLCGAGSHHHGHQCRISPPKTPAPGRSSSGGAPSATAARRYPNWHADATASSSESSPECDSRPSTSRSTQTSASAFSSRFSLASEEPRCASPSRGGELSEPFPALSTQSSSGLSDLVGSSSFSRDAAAAQPPPAPRAARPARRAVWTRAMTDHLWVTYNLYMQDPRVTPFQMGVTGVPPLGVCIRVAREAKRSWKGLRVVVHSHGGTAAPSQWPHTCAATRTWLRELCKRKAGTSQARGAQAMASTPAAAPGQMPTRHRARRAAAAAAGGGPARSPLASAFGNVDMAVSLALSTAESMQPNGPLAQLMAGAGPPPLRPRSESPGTAAAAAAPLPASSSPSPPLPAFSFPAAPPPEQQQQQQDHHHHHHHHNYHNYHHPQQPVGLGLGWPASQSTNTTDSGWPLAPLNTIDGGPLAAPWAASRSSKRGLQSPVKISHSRSKSAVHKAAPQKMRSRAATNDARRSRRPSMSDMVSAEMLAHMPTLEQRPPVTPMPGGPLQQQQQGQGQGGAAAAAAGPAGQMQGQAQQDALGQKTQQQPPQPLPQLPPQIMEPAVGGGGGMAVPPRHYHDDSDVPRTPMHARGSFRPRALTTMNEMSPMAGVVMEGAAGGGGAVSGSVYRSNLGVAGADARPLRLGSPFMANPAFSFPGGGESGVDEGGRGRGGGAGHRRLWSDSPY